MRKWNFRKYFSNIAYIMCSPIFIATEIQTFSTLTLLKNTAAIAPFNPARPLQYFIRIKLNHTFLGIAKITSFFLKLISLSIFS